MTLFVNKLQLQLDQQLYEFNATEEDFCKKAERCLGAALGTLDELKEFIINYTFTSKEEEIYFFKILKPQFVAKTIYYLKLVNLQPKMPMGSNKALKKFLLTELEQLNHYFDNNMDFYQYYRSGAVALDEKYFLRGRQETWYSLDGFFLDADNRFSTSHDYKVSKILANELLRAYFNKELNRIENSMQQLPLNSQPVTTGLKWTASKTDLAELIYALHAAGCINSANTDLKKIANVFETVFNIDLGDYYRMYVEMRLRKNRRTRLLDALKEQLVRKMDEDDSR